MRYNNIRTPSTISIACLDMLLMIPDDFTNPLEKKIIALQKEYTKGIAEGKVFEEMKELKIKIKILKAEINLMRRSEDLPVKLHSSPR